MERKENDMEKLKKDLFLDKSLTHRSRLYSGILNCSSNIGGTMTTCCNPSGGCLIDRGQ
jgi:hypothetical protein